MRKKSRIRTIILKCLSVCIIIGISGVVYIDTAPRLELKSSDGSWRVVCFQENRHVRWEGCLIYEGEEKVGGIMTELLYNGEE